MKLNVETISCMMGHQIAALCIFRDKEACELKYALEISDFHFVVPPLEFL